MLVLDLGTTNMKLAKMSRGRVLARWERSMETQREEAGEASQDPDLALEKLLELLGEGLAAYPGERQLIFSTQMHSLLLTDKKGRVLVPSLTWADQRADAAARKLWSLAWGERAYQLTGTPIHSMSPLVKLLALKDQFDLGQCYAMGLKTYLYWQLTGERAVDGATAAATGLYDFRKKEWSPELLDLVGIAAENLPKLVSVGSGKSLNKFSLEAWAKRSAEAAGGSEQLSTEQAAGREPLFAEQAERRLALVRALPEALQIYQGSTDGALANLGAEVLLPPAKSQRLILSFGTSAALRLTSQKAVLSPGGSLFSYQADDGDHYIVGGPLNNAGSALDWLVDRGGFEDYDDFFDQILAQPRKASGPIFLPYLSGERAPFWNGRLEAAFIGLSQESTRQSLAQAGFEGIFFQIRLLLETLLDSLRAAGTGPEKSPAGADGSQKPADNFPDQEGDGLADSGIEICASGKVFSRPDVAQWIADILGQPYKVFSAEDLSFYGAYSLLSKEGLSRNQAENLVSYQPENPDFYREKYTRFRAAAQEANRASLAGD